MVKPDSPWQVEQEVKEIQPKVQMVVYHLAENKEMRNSEDSLLELQREHLQNQIWYKTKQLLIDPSAKK